MSFASNVVVLDTDVWSHLYAARRKHERDAHWRELLRGSTVVVATQTKAEVLAGLASSGVGAERLATIQQQLALTATVPVTDDVVAAYVSLTAHCRRAGHGLHDKIHTGDRWVAATAIAIGASLLSSDRIYRGAPGVTLLDDSKGTLHD